MLGFRVPNTSVGPMGERARRRKWGQRGTKHIVFRVPTTSVGVRGEGKREQRGVKHIVY